MAVHSVKGGGVMLVSETEVVNFLESIGGVVVAAGFMAGASYAVIRWALQEITLCVIAWRDRGVR